MSFTIYWSRRITEKMNSFIYTHSVPSCVQRLEFHPLMACVCAWHPNKAEGDSWAKRHGIAVTHGICADCKKRVDAETVDSMREAAVD